MMSDYSLWFLLFWGVSQLVLHEIGHYIMYRVFGVKPKISLKWWGVTIGEVGDYFRVSPRKWYFIALAGPLVSVVYTMILIPGETDLILIVLLASFFDLMHMYMVLSNWKKNRDCKTYGHMVRRELLNDYHDLTDLMEEVYEGRTLIK